jgi:REP element-mobilizing transposase RayT
MIRGVNGCTIFRSVADFEDFLARFALLVRELGFEVLAWCLLGNHAHFILRTGQAQLAELMARLTGRHAQRFNRESGRFGHLFQDRYKALLIEDDGRLASDAAYVLGNALRHALVTPSELGDYVGSAYGALIGRREPRSFESVERIAAALGVDPAHAAEYVEEHALAPDARAAALEPGQIDELNRMIRDACRARGVSVEFVRAADSEARSIRRDLLTRASAALDLPLRTIAREIGMPYRTARKLSSKLRASEGARGV